MTYPTWCPPQPGMPPFVGLFPQPLPAITVVAAGTNQLTATPTSLAQILVASGSGGIVLPQAATFNGNMVFVFNRCGSMLTVYPYSGDQIETNAVNTGISLNNGHTAIFAVSSSGILLLTAI